MAIDTIELELVRTALADHLGDERAAKIVQSGRAIRQAVEDFRQTMSKIVASGQLTPQGLAQRQREKAAEANRKLAQFDRELETIEARIASERGRARRPEAPSDPATAIRVQEIRALLRERDPLGVHELFLNAVQEGNDPLLEVAVETAPAIAPLVTVGVMAEARRIRERAASSDLEWLEAARDTIRGWLAEARRELGVGG